MSLCSYSSNLAMNGATMVDNTFISEFLPSAPEKAVKVYLYGLFLCSTPTADDNSLDSMCTVLSLSEDEIYEIFSYWQNLGLVQIVNNTPFEIKYLSARESSGSSKIRQKGKYKDFNDQIQAILSGRMIKPIEFNEYYNLIENHHFEPEALIMIIKYCTSIKSNDISFPYILAVAKSFAERGIKTTTALENELMEQEKSTGQIKAVLKALGLNRDADLEERNMYLKWTNNFGFTDKFILEVAKTLNKKGGFNRLNETLIKLYEQRLFTLDEFENYSKEKEMLYAIAKKVTSTLGIYYQNLESVVEVYIKDWINKGYDEETLSLLSSYCFKQDIKSLSLMNEVVLKFYKKGIVNIDSLNNYFASIVKEDEAIKKILSDLSIVRRVTSQDREFYKTWTEDWQIPAEIIELAKEKSKGSTWPIRLMNKLLLDIHSKGITDLAKAKQEFEKSSVKNETAVKTFNQREYTSEQLSALFDSLDDIEV